MRTDELFRLGVFAILLTACSPTTAHPDDIAVLRATVQEQTSRFVACYSAGQKANPALAGRVSLKMIVRENGVVENVTLQVNELGDVVGTCFVNAFTEMKMPRLLRDTPFEESFCFDPSPGGVRCRKTEV